MVHRPPRCPHLPESNVHCAVQARQTADSLLLTYGTLFSGTPFRLILLTCPGQEVPLSLSSPVVNSYESDMHIVSAFIAIVCLAGFRSEIAVKSDPFLWGWQCTGYSLFVVLLEKLL